MDVELTVPGAEPPAGPRVRRALPRLFFIAEGFVDGRAGMAAEEVRARTEAVVEAGVRAVQLRDHHAPAEAYAERTAELAALLRVVDPHVLLSVNGRPDLARALGLALQVGRRGPSVPEARRLLGPGALVGYSAHSASDARRAAEAGADFVFVSPLFRTPSHPGFASGGLDLLRRACAAVAALPAPPAVYALGGVTPEEAAGCLEAGAHGVAVLSGLLDAPDPGAAVRAYLDALAV
jgi:thiamine-phosphate pyrophosphorylase